MQHSLPVIGSCDNCGACCREQQSPPGYVMLLNSPDIMEEPGDFADDVERLQSMPDAPMGELRKYLRNLLNGVEPDDPACIWLDRSTMRCRYHEQRPSICRDFEMGSADCHDWRQDYGVDQ